MDSALINSRSLTLPLFSFNPPDLGSDDGSQQWASFRTVRHSSTHHVDYSIWLDRLGTDLVWPPPPTAPSRADICATLRLSRF
mgnify:CR=1 FL=1